MAGRDNNPRYALIKVTPGSVKYINKLGGYLPGRAMRSGDRIAILRALFKEAAEDGREDSVAREILGNAKVSLSLIHPFVKELNIVLGASSKAQPGWIPTEQESLDITRMEDWNALFSTRPIDRIMAEHVWEHLAEADGGKAAGNAYRYLRRGGRIRVAVPDGLHPSLSYIEAVKPGGTGPGSLDHRALYTYKTLGEVFRGAGFRVELLEYFDEKGVFHHKPWDEGDGLIIRSRDHDERNAVKELTYTSIILDGFKD